MPGKFIATAAMLAVGLTFSGFRASAETLVESGTFKVEVLRVSFIGSAARGKGVLHYKGKNHKFTATGLGAGGVGASKSVVTGTAYNMKKLDDFVGTYVNARSGIAVGDKSKSKSIWVQNEKGVRLEAKSKTKGLQLNLGVDGVLVTWDK
jgi:hypothetical protein